MVGMWPRTRNRVLLWNGRTTFRRAAVVVLLVVSGGCDFGQQRSLEDSLLVEVLADLYLEEADMAYREARPVGRRDSILAVHGVTEDQLESALEFHARDADQYLLLYEELLNRLSERREEERRRQRAEADSLAAAGSDTSFDE